MDSKGIHLRTHFFLSVAAGTSRAAKHSGSSEERSFSECSGRGTPRQEQACLTFMFLCIVRSPVALVIQGNGYVISRRGISNAP
jgi:hypothetical protein